jgi:hypothetical protein
MPSFAGRDSAWNDNGAGWPARVRQDAVLSPGLRGYVLGMRGETIAMSGRPIRLPSFRVTLATAGVLSGAAAGDDSGTVLYIDTEGAFRPDR